MKLFSFKSLCLRWRGELIDNANVPVGLGEEGERGRDGGEMEVGGLIQVFNFHFKYHMGRISIDQISFISVSVESFCKNSSLQWTHESQTRLTHLHINMHAHRHAHLCYWQGQSELSVSRSPKAQGSYRLQLRCVCVCVCALATPQCVCCRAGNGSKGSDSVTLP